MDSIHQSRKVAVAIVSEMCKYGMRSLMKIMLQCTDINETDWAVWHAVQAGMRANGAHPADSAIMFAVQRVHQRLAHADAKAARRRQPNKYLLKYRLAQRRFSFSA